MTSTKTLVVHPHLPKKAEGAGRDPQAMLDEAINLTQALPAMTLIEGLMTTVKMVRPATFLGQGFVDELAPRLKDDGIELVIVNTQLSPVQQRNLEKAWNCKVLDRTGLILEIFGARASTREGVLQVELAALTYQRSRLVRTWTHLERQRGGFGFTGGPGETQLEIDRRLIDERMIRLKKDLEKIKRTRGLHRQARKKVPYPVVALVGYTNAGKSTLFNRLAKADVFAQDLLFATLDPTMRRVRLPSGQMVILSDTVGFISQLPTALIAAFRATLEEVLEADAILHVRDLSHPDTQAQNQDVLNVLEELGVDPHRDNFLEVWNKMDLVDPENLPGLEIHARSAGAIGVSALTGMGMVDLLGAVDHVLHAQSRQVHVAVDGQDAALQAWIHRHAQVLSVEHTDTQAVFHIRITPIDYDRLRAQENIKIL